MSIESPLSQEQSPKEVFLNALEKELVEMEASGRITSEQAQEKREAAALIETNFSEDPAYDALIFSRAGIAGEKEMVRIFDLKKPTELRKNVSEQQSEAYAETLVRIMERSNDNVELVNALRDFIREIDSKAWKGEVHKPMSEGYIKRLTEFFEEKTEELRRLV